MHRRFTALIASTVLGGSALFAACSAPATTPPAPASTAPSTSVPSEAPSSPAPSSAEPTSAESSGGSDSAKPSKAEIVAGLAVFYETKQGLTSSQAKKFAVCMVDEMYDRAKPKTLVAMKDGDPTKIEVSDAGLIAEAGVTCANAQS